ncbi:hypothetical protein [Streptomyces alboflavus]|uniref:hypothetical protein n=1 Tax=Streptomyces alboflavus TaxID=67267 RepID=UPI003673B3FE
MIKPEDIPQFTGDLDALQRHITGLRRDADGIRQAGGAAHTQFQAMSAFYKAPEAEDLFASTMPVRDKADAFAEKVETVAGALDEYARTVGPIAEKLKHLKAKARTFIASLDTDGGAFGTDWTKDQDKVDQHDALWDELAAARAAFYAAEITAANKITSLVDGGTQYMADTGGNMFVPRGVTTYGFTADALKNADKLPWGTPAERTHHAWDLGYHGKQLLWDGLVMDGIVGSLKGAAALAGLRGPGEARAAWDGLTRTLVGGAVYATEMGGNKPGGNFWNSDFVQDSKPYAKEFAKGLVAWDQWKENPGRAAGTTIFNFGTLGAGPVKVATAGRAGAMAKAAHAAARAGDAMDPVVAAAKGARSLPRVGDLAAGMRAGAHGASSTPRSAYTVWELPEGSRVRLEDGKFTVKDRHGNPSAAPVPREASAGERAMPKESSVRGPERQPVLAGVRDGDGAVGAVGRVDGDLPGGSAARDGIGEAGRHAPGGRAHESVRGPSAHHESPAGPPRDGSSSGTDHASGGHHGRDGGHHSGESPVNGHAGDGHTADSGTGHDNPGYADAPHGSGASAGHSPGSGPSGPLQLGGDAEHRLREAIKGIPKNTMKPKVLEKAISRLAEHPYGREVAEVISSGKFSHATGFRDLVSQLGSGVAGQHIRAIDQIKFGDQLHASGLRNIEFEIKNSARKADLDVKVTDDAGNSFGYQMKRLNNPKDPFEQIARADYLGQLSKSQADVKVMLVDGQGTVADWTSRGIPEELLRVHRGEHALKSEKGHGILFVLRLDDGTIVIPPGAKVDPRGVL